MHQVKIFRTIVVDAPCTPAASSKPSSPTTSTWADRNVEIIFRRRVRLYTICTFRTAIDRRDNGGVLRNVSYRHSRIKQHLKDGRAMRIETVINHSRDLGCNARLPNPFHRPSRELDPNVTNLATKNR